MTISVVHSPELTGREQVVGPLLNVDDGHIEPGGDDSALVQATGQVDNDLAGPVVVDDLELANVAVLHHDRQELDDHLGAGTQQDLSLAALLSVVNALEGIGQNVHSHHLEAAREGEMELVRRSTGCTLARIVLQRV